MNIKEGKFLSILQFYKESQFSNTKIKNASTKQNPNLDEI